MAKTKILTKDGLEIYDSKIKDYIDTGLENKVSKTDIVNNLVSTDVDAPLSAMQGKILKDTIDRLEVPGAVIYRGTIGTDGDIVKLPTTYKRGDMYRVVTEGTYSEQKCEVGDFLFCTRDNILTVAKLPTNYDTSLYMNYIIYQMYNPQTNENEDVYFTAIQGGKWYFDEKDGAKQLYATGGAFGWTFSSKDNGVSWTEINRNVWYGSLFTETETSSIEILHSTFIIHNNDNSIQYSVNPWSLSGYATDWAVIQGNLEDMIGEGAIYIDPDETSSEIESVDSVTSAKLVSYSNTNSGLEATNVQEAIEQLETQKVDLTTVESKLDSKVSKTDVVDNLMSSAIDVPLSANQGNVLNSMISGKGNMITKTLTNGASISIDFQYGGGVSFIAIVSVSSGPDGYGIYHGHYMSSKKVSKIIENISGSAFSATIGNGLTVTAGSGISICVTIIYGSGVIIS